MKKIKEEIFKELDRLVKRRDDVSISEVKSIIEECFNNYETNGSREIRDDPGGWDHGFGPKDETNGSREIRDDPGGWDHGFGPKDW